MNLIEVLPYIKSLVNECWGEMIDLDKIDSTETPNEIIDPNKDHQRVTLDERSLGDLLNVRLGSTHAH